ncbi:MULTISPECIES: hypothetical protein [Kribbella]|uniref:Uncharacterized protein n=1 Tax=Kribbella karoonensis TaxID=324851 RepID=A0ABN2DDD7_9ACTN
MPTYVRYQSPVPDRRGRRIGIFGLVNMLANRGYLTADEERFRRTTNDWYDAAYTNPSSVYEDNPHAAAWFKPTATHLLEPIPGYLKILTAHNLPCARYTATTPGRVLYEDEHQLVVVPPPDDTAPTTIMWLRPKAG